MSAKDELRNIVDPLSEEDARDIFPLLSGCHWGDAPGSADRRLTNRELLSLPRPLREMIIRNEIAQLSQEELDEQVAESEAWAEADADALKLIDD